MLSFTTLFGSLIALSIATIWYRRLNHPLRKFPGPFWASQTNIWRAYHLWTRHLPDTLIEMHRKYGPVVRIGPNDLSFQTVKAIDPIYKSGRKVIKSEFYDGFTTFHPNLFGTRNETLHATRRRQMAHSFSMSSLSQMEFIFDRHIQKLLDVIDSKQGAAFDLKTLIGFYTYDVMGELIFGADFGSQEAQLTEKLPPINDHIFLGCLYGMLPSLLPYSMQTAPHIPWSRLQNLLKSRKRLRDTTFQHVRSQMQNDAADEGHNILNRLILSKDPDSGETLSEDAISSEAFGFLVAGSHTTSGSLTLLFYHILHHPEAARKLRQEIMEFMPNNADESAIPAYTGLEMNLPYAMACVRESLRITPVFTMPLPRTIIDPEGMIIDGIHVPQGVNVCMTTQVTHHDVNAWGGNESLFRPERWLDSTAQRLSSQLMPFGAGHRACIGRNIAMMSIVKVFSTLWRRYEITAVDGDEKLVVESVGIGEKKGPLIVTAKLRS